MWFSFPITRTIRVGLPWWCFPLVLLVLVIELAFMAVVFLLHVAAALLAPVLPRNRRERRGEDNAKVTIIVREKPAETTQRPGEIG